MDNFVYYLCVMFDAVLNPLIIILFAAEFIIMLITIRKMKALTGRIDKINGVSSRQVSKVLVGSKKKKKTFTAVTELDWEEFDRFCDDYQKDGRWYTAFSLIIQLFTLLGILGTVAGLFLAMRDNNDWQSAEGMYEGVKFALSSTVLGIIAAIIFKAIDVILSSKYVNYIDDGISRFQNNYNEIGDKPEKE